MSVPERYQYTDEELRSYLPSGWELVGGGEAAWDEKRQAVRLRVRDNVDFDWSVDVKARDADRDGRLEALRQAMQQVFRGRLGPSTRGLGLAS
jgi:hypothetical protein